MTHYPCVMVLVSGSRYSHKPFKIQWPHKTGTRKQYEIVVTKIINVIPNYLHSYYYIGLRKTLVASLWILQWHTILKYLYYCFYYLFSSFFLWIYILLYNIYFSSNVLYSNY